MQGNATRGVQADTSSVLGARVSFPGEDAGNSLAQIAQRDLDAALQLLADRAQYITEANGAAIALRRDGRNDMLCRASTGENAPELGALLSTEFGLSGESVRTRKALRCDDAERDPRVNREVCRQLGISSVVVMPVVNDDEVLGVFELFSGKSNAFNERDMSALQRLSEMVETAVRLAQLTETFPERLLAQDVSAPRVSTAEVQPTVVEMEVETEAVEAPASVEVAATASVPVIPSPAVSVSIPVSLVPAAKVPVEPEPEIPAFVTETPAAPPKKPPLFWSAAVDAKEGMQETAQVDRSHVPPVLRNLNQCGACGFPVSTGRELCVECEEKKWRGQLKDSRPKPKAAGAVPGAVPGLAAIVSTSRSTTGAATAAVMVPEPPKVAEATHPAMALLEPRADAQMIVGKVLTQNFPPLAETAVLPGSLSRVEVPPVEVMFSGGLEPSQSWLSANKYIFGALLVVGVVVAAILWLR